MSQMIFDIEQLSSILSKNVGSEDRLLLNNSSIDVRNDLRLLFIILPIYVPHEFELQCSYSPALRQKYIKPNSFKEQPASLKENDQGQLSDKMHRHGSQ